ncbi:CRE-CIC-1 protein [Caenorhabditis remanei]|uniref:CRE-CIC-1 protein n=1 Tax=Caenorhabditis remanei TaxID=31234 RepID=E3NII8_CAERE|nr:CRE-CIC-1 protein [Caenorhabditis remanei]
MAMNFWKSSHAQQWMFDKTEIWKQRAEDMKTYSEDEYNRLNIFWANFITAVATECAHSQANVGCKLRQQVIATAIVYFKRFYLRQSFRDMCPFLVASTALFLACKVEEHTTLSVSSFLKNTALVLPKRWGVTFETTSAKNGVLYDSEFILVEILDCCLVVYHPQRPMVELLDDFRLYTNSSASPTSPLKDFESIEAQCQKVINDTLRCDVGLIYAPHIIAISSILVAMDLMGRGEELEGWMVEVDVDMEKVADCTDQIYKMYTLWRSFDEKEEVKKLMAKLPKPNQQQMTQQQQHHHHHQQQSSSGYHM